jgi:hypothetical protein
LTFDHCKTYLRYSTYKEKRFISKSPSFGGSGSMINWSHWFWDYHKKAYHDRNVLYNKTTYPMTREQKHDKEGDQGSTTLFKETSQ